MLGKGGPEITRLCLGAMNFGNPIWGCDERAATALVHAYLERGGRLIDTANIYGDTNSESILGRALAGRRDRVVLATKAGFPTGEHAQARGLSRAHLREALEASLRRLRTDHVDLFQAHVWDRRTPLEETLGALDELVRAGLTRHVGCSNWTGWQLAEAACVCAARGLAPLRSLQTQYSLLVRDVELDSLVVAARHGIGVLAWSPLASGLLSGKYAAGAPNARLEQDAKGPRVWRRRLFSQRNFDLVAQVAAEALALGTTPARLALAWLLARPGLAGVIVGPRTPGQLEDAFLADALEVPREVADRLEVASRPVAPFPFDEADAIDAILYPG